MRAPVCLKIFGSECHRCPDLYLRKRKLNIRRHDAHYSVADTIEYYVLSDNVASSCKPTLPQAVTKNRDLIAPRLIFVDRETSPEQRVCTENRKELSRDFGGVDSFRVAAAGEIAANNCISSDG